MIDPGGLEELAAAAVEGNVASLDRLVRVLSDDVYHLSFWMLGHRADAEDATQEILLKVITRLHTYRGEASLRTWVWKVATNHLLNTRRGRREQTAGFAELEQALEAGLAARLPPPPEVDADLLEEEVKLGCTQTMLASLDRDHRLAFILGEVLEVPGPTAAEVLGIEPAAYRKRLSRARMRLQEFMNRRCGLVNQEAECRCRLQVGPSLAAGMIDPDNLHYTTHPKRVHHPELWRQHDAIKASEDEVLILRSHPDYGATPELIGRLGRLLATSPD